MAVHQVNGAEVKERNPFGVWALGIVTLGIYSFVWYYKANKEVRRAYGIDVDPGMTVLALTLGAFLVVPPFVAVYRTGRRIEEAQFKAGVQDRISPLGSFLLGFLFGLNMIYMQAHLNKIWMHVRVGGLPETIDTPPLASTTTTEPVVKERPTGP